jgi:hypothetical protein
VPKNSKKMKKNMEEFEEFGFRVFCGKMGKNAKMGGGGGAWWGRRAGGGAVVGGEVMGGGGAWWVWILRSLGEEGRR